MSRIALVEFLQRGVAGFWLSEELRGAIDCPAYVVETFFYLSEKGNSGSRVNQFHPVGRRIICLPTKASRLAQSGPHLE